jgi:hypothetical protein
LTEAGEESRLEMEGSGEREKRAVRRIELEKVPMRKVLLLMVAVLALPALAGNIVLNSSFEMWLLGVPLGWLSSELLSPGSATQDSNSHTGSWCVRLEAADTSAFVTSATIVSPGLSYEFAGWARVPGALGGSFVLQFTQLDGTLIGSPTLIPAYYSGANYREYRRWVTAPDSSRFLSISFATIAGLVAYVDDVTLDDTTLAGVEEVVPVPCAQVAQPRKLVVCGGAARSVGVLVPLFDPLGRRVNAGAALGRGIYFVLPR